MGEQFVVTENTGASF